VLFRSLYVALDQDAAAAVGALVLVVATGCAEGAPPTPNPSASEAASASPGVTLPPVGTGCRDPRPKG
jgi:hypothetical protein